MTIKYNLLLILIIAGIHVCQAQQSLKKDEAIRISKIAEEFSVSRDKAKEIIMVLDYNSTALQNALHDSTLNPYDKHQRIRSLIAGRTMKIREVLSPEQQNRLRELQSTYEQKFSQQRRRDEAKHEEAMKNVRRGAILKSRTRVNNLQ